MVRTSLKSNIVVTGGAGFIGSHVTKKLCNAGYRVTVIDDLSFGYFRHVDPRARFIKGSIGDWKCLLSALNGASAVIHLAASSIISLSYEQPIEYYKNNVTAGIMLLEAMRKNGVKKIIYSSTAAVYGEPKRIPIKETDPLNPKTIYGSSKLAFEHALLSYYHSFGIESVSLRYFNAYGERDDQKPATRAVPIWIRALIHNEQIPLYWRGKQFRDYVYAGDIAQAHIDVLPLKGLHTFNIGSGKGVLMKDMISVLEKIIGKAAKIAYCGNRPGDPEKLVADISQIKKTVGWRPMISLEAGLARTYEYYASVS